MDRETIMVTNWLFLPLLTLATIILIWKMIGEKLKRKAFSSELLNGSLVLSLAAIGMLQLNIERSLSWIHWVLLGVQSLMLVFLLKQLWSAPSRDVSGRHR